MSFDDLWALCHKTTTGKERARRGYERRVKPAERAAFAARLRARVGRGQPTDFAAFTVLWKNEETPDALAPPHVVAPKKAPTPIAPPAPPPSTGSCRFSPAAPTAATEDEEEFSLARGAYPGPPPADAAARKRDLDAYLREVPADERSVFLQAVICYRLRLRDDDTPDQFVVGWTKFCAERWRSQAILRKTAREARWIAEGLAGRLPVPPEPPPVRDSWDDMIDAIVAGAAARPSVDSPTASTVVAEPDVAPAMDDESPI